MKTLLKLFMVIAMSASAVAQEIPRPAQATALTISTAYVVAGSSTTNVPTADAPIVSFGKNGLGLYLRLAGTNAATTTNATVTLEQVIGVGSTVHVIDGPLTTIAVSAAQNGTTGYDAYTNILNTAHANYPNARFRIRSIQNTNLASIFISNAVYTIRE